MSQVQHNYRAQSSMQTYDLSSLQARFLLGLSQSLQGQEMAMRKLQRLLREGGPGPEAILTAG